MSPTMTFLIIIIMAGIYGVATAQLLILFVQALRRAIALHRIKARAIAFLILLKT